MKEVCLHEYDGDPCGFAVLVTENEKYSLIATIPINWIMLGGL